MSTPADAIATTASHAVIDASADFVGLTETLRYRDITGLDERTGIETLSEELTATFRFRQRINAGVLLAASAINGASKSAQGTGAVFDLLMASSMPGEYDRLMLLINDNDKQVEIDDLLDLNRNLIRVYSGERPTSRPAG